MFGKKFLFLYILYIFPFAEASSAVLDLDSSTFNKTIQAFTFSFIMFIAESQKETYKYKQFELLAQDLIGETSILIASATIPGYGSRKNHDLAERFQLDQGKLPELIFLSKSPLPGKETVLQETRYGSDFNLEQLRNFVQSKTGVWIVLAGCLSEFDELAQLFVRNSRSGKDRHKIIEETIKLIDSCEDEGRVQIGKMYLRIMKIMHEKEDKDFVQSEKTRIEKLLEQSISAPKKEELQRKLNILKSFEVRRNQRRDEL